MREYPQITPILRQLVLNAPNGLPAKAIAGFLNRDYTTLLAEVGERSGHKAGVELLLPIMDVTESTLPMDVIADALGGFFVRLPRLDGTPHDIARQCMASVREFGDLMSATAAALEDGVITAEEHRDISDKGYRAQVAILTLLKLVNDTYQKDGKSL